MSLSEVIDIEAELLPEAFEKVTEVCCKKYLELDAPLTAHIELYGVWVDLTQDNVTGKTQRRICYKFLVTYKREKFKGP